MSWLKISGMVLAMLLLLMSFAHALLGWPALRAELEYAGVSPGSEIWNTVAAGWIFGSISMFVFGVIFASVVLSLCKGRNHIVPIVAIGIGYLAFGLGACVLLDVNPHFVGFVVFGILFLIWTIVARRASCKRFEELP